MGWVQQTGVKEILLGGLSRPDRNIHAANEHTTIEDLMGLARSILFYLAKDFTKTEKGSGVQFVLKPNKYRNTLFIVDEASMIGGCYGYDVGQWPHTSHVVKICIRS